MKEYTKICKYCGKEFITTSKQRTCCCTTCSYAQGTKVMLERGNEFKRVYNLNDNFLKNLTPDSCWFLGLMASDGCIQKHNNTISISQSGENGLKIITYIKKILNFEGNILCSKTIGNDAYSLSFRSSIMLEDLEKYNITEKKTHIFKIPDIILKNENYLKWFLWGYIDGDGSIGIYNNMLTISFVCNHVMFEQLKNIPLLSKCNFYKNKRKSVDVICINGGKAVEFGDILFDNNEIYKSYKYNKYLYFKEHRTELSPRYRANIIREKLYKEFNKNPNLNCIDYANSNNINVKFVYRVRKEWRTKQSIDI